MFNAGIKIYKVGGAIRDRLLGINSSDNDYVVVGATPEYMIANGFTQVGRDFPVFIHPKTHEEYALARTERKTSNGHNGFACNATPDVTLNDDLSRRDITINAIAEDEAGNLIDPYNGICDLKNRIIRHVSTAFSEDPLRVIRVARFRAKFDFTIHPETINIMKQVVASGEIKYLSHERIFAEIKKVLAYNTITTKSPIITFLSTLEQVNALEIISPKLSQLMNQRDFINRLNTAFINLQNMCLINNQNNIAQLRFALIIGVATTYTNSEDALEISLLSKKENVYNKLAILTATNLNKILQLKGLIPSDILLVITHLDPIRTPSSLDQIEIILSAISGDSSNIKLIRNIAHEFKLINYQNIKNALTHDLFIKKINSIKLEIINRILSTQEY